ncbi:MAG: hypothetical protein D6753_15570 [Planctomycetota bacterium]|nr:MAG: hypothetical protein D6753_15570 [Planctomycetota bacterium]
MFDCGKNAVRGRFVLLRHTYPVSQSGTDHWDLMLESPGGDLLTWRLLALPEPFDQGASLRLPAERLPNHRLQYLEYEGPISGGRGAVRRAEAGRFAAQWTGDRCQPPSPIVGSSGSGQAPDASAAPQSAMSLAAVSQPHWEVRLTGATLSARLAIPSVPVGVPVELVVHQWHWRC